MRKEFWVVWMACLITGACGNNNAHVQAPHEKEQAADSIWRPVLHFTPEKHWMNDPNGMVFFDGKYHLFYQHNPENSKWGPMHWGHASSSNLVNWKHHPIALYPDTLGTIFSGSAVVDSNNTSGLGKDGKIPLIAIFTHHDAEGEKAGRINFQQQSIAISLDDGMTWEKYKGNPVLKNPGIRDFRDPKIIWHAPSEKWVMTLAAGQEIMFYSSPNLIDWKKESDFGAGLGAHGGVWECPDLFPIMAGTKPIWVLIVNINPGAPNGGSGTQYFLGEFDGQHFVAADSVTRWLDYGPDNYAGVTWSNAGDRRLLIGWMSNWLYANDVPTSTWRSAMTVARELKMKQGEDGWRLSSEPVLALGNLFITSEKFVILKFSDPIVHHFKSSEAGKAKVIKLTGSDLASFKLTFSNVHNEKMIIGFDETKQEYYLDRHLSGDTSFHPAFASRATAPRFIRQRNIDLTIVIDKMSVELFADAGRTAMTAICFPSAPYNQLGIQSSQPTGKAELEIRYGP